MDLNFLEFEQPIAELEAKIEELRLLGSDNEINIQEEIGKLEAKSKSLTESIFFVFDAMADIATRTSSAAPLYAGLYRPCL